MKGHLRERGPGRWAIVIEMQDPETGQRKRKWHSFKGTKREAQTETSRLISAISAGTYIEPSKIRLRDFLERWLEHIKPQVSPRTFERYTELVRKNINPLLGAVVLTKLRPIQISDAYGKALTSGRRDGQEGLSPSTVRYLHAILNSALKQAVRWQMLARNPVDAVDPPKFERKTMNTYDLAQTANLIDATRGTRMTITVILAVLCGLRRGEIAALRWRNINLGSGQLTVLESAEQTDAGVRYKQPKSGKGRMVALSARVVNEHAVIVSSKHKNFFSWAFRWETMHSSLHRPMVAHCSRELSPNNGLNCSRITGHFHAFASTISGTLMRRICCRPVSIRRLRASDLATPRSGLRWICTHT